MKGVTIRRHYQPDPGRMVAALLALLESPPGASGHQGQGGSSAANQAPRLVGRGDD